jgi:hypothetical protein
MDSLIAAAARALAAGDALGALKRVALRDDPPALALRGIAMAQLGEHPRARDLLKRAARSFGAQEGLARARCIVADAEVALAMRDFRDPPRTLERAAVQLEARADRANALQARLIAVRRLLLLGRLEEAGAALSRLDGQGLPPALLAIAEMASAELALRSLQTAAAQAALGRALAAAGRAAVPALVAEAREAQAALERPAARRIDAGREQPLRLDEVEALLSSETLVIDACRRGVGVGTHWLALTRRPVLFALARTLAEAWPGDVDRNTLIAQAFRAKRPNESHRSRLRVEIGRLRALAAPLLRIEASPRGFALLPRAGRGVAVLVPPIDGEQASLLAILADGAAWPTSALALALGASQRTVQRALAELEASGRVRAIGQARSRRWLAPPLTGITTNLLLPVLLPQG